LATPTSKGSVTLISASSSAQIDALLGSYKWGGSTGRGATLTYSFRSNDSHYATAGSEYGASTGAGEPWGAGWFLFTDAQKQAIRDALALWSKVAGVQFVEVTDSATVAGDLRFGFTTNTSPGDGANAWAYFPGASAKAGDVWFANSFYDALAAATPGSYGFFSAVHEIGHALGFKHPHEGSPTLSQLTDYVGHTVMSYRDHLGDGTGDGYGSDFLPTTPMRFDLDAAQYLYGANGTANADDTTYSWADNAQVFETIWDTGGIDTFDCSNQSKPVIIKLGEGEWSAIGTPRWDGNDYDVLNVAIASGTVIENAIGGLGDDFIVGNDADNVLGGREGADILFGKAGNDRFGLWGDYAADGQVYNGGSPGVPGTGESLSMAGRFGSWDTIYGGAGFDGIVCGATDDVVFLDDGVGEDPLFTSIEYFQGGEGDDIIDLTSARFSYDPVVLFGEAGRDVLWGNAGGDVLVGGGGRDSMAGGAGNDLYGVTAGDVVIELAGGGVDTVETAASYTLPKFVEKLTLTGSEAVSGTGNGSANTILGNKAGNLLKGLGGADVLKGGGGADKLYGGAGNDKLTGGAGADKLVFDTALNATSNKDTILDFRHLTDRIWLDDDIFKKLGPASGVRDLLPGRFKVLNASAELDGNDFILYKKATGELFYDTNGVDPGGRTLFAVLGTDTHPTLTYADFQVIA